MAVEERILHRTITFLNATMKDLVQEIRSRLALPLTSARLSLNPLVAHPKAFDACYMTISENFAHIFRLDISCTLDKLFLHHDYKVTVGFREIMSQLDLK